MHPLDDPADVARYEEISRRLVTTVATVVPGWIERLIQERLARDVAGGASPSMPSAEAVADAARAARDEAVAALSALVAVDVDEQTTNPLAVLRAVTGHAHDVLAAAGVSAVARDHFARSSFPDDSYDLVPAAWSDVHEDLHEPGMMWSAAKAFLFTSRRRREGRT